MRQIISARPVRVKFTRKLIEIEGNSMRLVGQRRGFHQPRIACDRADERKFAVIDEVKARLAKSGAEVSDIDGVRVKENGGWWLLRASNTQAVLVARAEADNPANLEKELRARFNYREPGEKLIIIVPQAGSGSSSQSSSINQGQ